MTRPGSTKGRAGATPSMMTKGLLVPILGAMAMTGCIQVSAPEKPIEINLNVNVRQEVVVRLQEDAADFIENNPELFPE